MTMTALIDFSDPHDSAAPRLRHAFGTPRQVLVAHTLAEVVPLLDAVQAAAQQGAWCVGYVRYEAAPAFDAALVVHTHEGPLAWFAVYDEALPWPEFTAPEAAGVQVDWHTLPSRPAFDTAMDSLHRAIAAGELYQVNLTAPMHGSLSGTSTQPALALFHALQRAQPGGYAAFVDTGDTQLLSVSPELFFDWRDGQILARPMKGTAARGANPVDDAAQAQALRTSPKERAENVMIVDLLRNDLSRVAEPFSVQVPRLFHTEALPSVWQMTSDVVARSRAGSSLADLFSALFPCGSVTGAPKVRAMQMIHQLEPEARGVYCGAMGVVRPATNGLHGVQATFNVPIRTVAVQGTQVRCGIGSGITADATAPAEWQEWLHKRAFVERASMPFDLLETLALEDGQLRHAAEHLQRMAAAAAHFGYPFSTLDAQQHLNQLVQSHPQGLWRVRLLLAAQGTFSVPAFAMDATPSLVRLQLASTPLAEAHGEFVRFKTTRRAHYDAHTPTTPGVFDTVLWNPEGEITECTRGNIALLLDGRWVTPPLACGLLSGIGRTVALREGRVAEAVVRVDEVKRVQAWAFLNSLRGWVAAELV